MTYTNHAPDPKTPAPPSTLRRLEPVQIAAILDGVATVVRRDGNADLMVPFAVNRFARKAGATAAAVSVSTDPVDQILDLGSAWQDAIRSALAAPGSRSQVVRAVSVVIEQVLAELQRRVPA